MYMPLSAKRVLVIIPAFNEGKSITQVVKRVQTTIPYVDIVVINDGSNDNTSREANRTGATVIDLPSNLGIGGAMQTGYKYADRNNYDIAVQIDGDGQHDPRDLEKLLQVLREEQVDLVIGSRFVHNSGYKPSLFRATGIKLFSCLISRITGQTVKDTTSGYRAVNKKVIGLFARNYPTDYPEVEVLVLLNRHRLKIKEVPVNMAYRTTGTSSINTFKSFYYLFKVVLAIFIMLTRQKPGGLSYDI